MKNIKHELYNLCQAYLQQRLLTAKQAIEAAQQAANNQTKSSSGDKYETGRAMMQLEIKKDSAQLSESLKLKHALDQISSDNSSINYRLTEYVLVIKVTSFVHVSL